MALAQKPRSIADWEKLGVIPAIRPGADVLVFSLIGGGEEVGSPSRHPCGLENRLEPRKQAICWNDTRAKWEPQANYQLASDELLLEFSVEAPAFKGRCHGVFYSRSRMQYVAALHADVLRLVPSTRAEEIPARAKARVQTLRENAPAQAKLAELEQHFILLAERARQAQAQFARLRDETRRLDLPRVVHNEIHRERERRGPPPTKMIVKIAKRFLAKGQSAEAAALRWQRLAQYGAKVTSPNALRIQQYAEEMLKKTRDWSASDARTTERFIELVEKTQAASDEVDKLELERNLVERQLTELQRRWGLVDSARVRLARARQATGPAQKLYTEQQRGRILLPQLPAFTRPEEEQVLPPEERKLSLADLAFAAVQPFESAAPGYTSPTGEKSVIPSATRDEEDFQNKKAELTALMYDAEAAMEKEQERLSEYMKKRGITKLPDLRRAEGQEELERLQKLHSRLRAFLAGVREKWAGVVQARERLQVHLGPNVQLPPPSTSQATYALEKFLRHDIEGKKARAELRKKEAAEKLKQAEEQEAREKYEAQKAEAELSVAKMRKMRKKKTKDQLDGLRGMTRPTGAIRRLWEL